MQEYRSQPLAQAPVSYVHKVKVRKERSPNSIPVQLEEPRSEGTVLWEFISIDNFLGTSLRMWLLCADVISYKGGNGSHSLGRYEQKQLFTSPQDRAAGHGGFPTLSCIL